MLAKGALEGENTDCDGKGLGHCIVQVGVAEMAKAVDMGIWTGPLIRYCKVRHDMVLYTLYGNLSIATFSWTSMTGNRLFPNDELM